MHLNKLRDIKRIKNEKFKFSSVGEDDGTSDEDNSLPNGVMIANDKEET